MGRIVYKYDIMRTPPQGERQLVDEFTIELPHGAEPLATMVQNEVPKLWVLHVDNPAAPKQARHFRVFGTGHPIPDQDDMRLTHIGTFQLQGGRFVYHLFEEGAPA